MTRHIHQHWRDEQGPSKYPFADGASLTSVDGISLAEDTFLDAHLYPIGGTAGLYLTKMSVFADRVEIFIGNAANTELCSTTFDPLQPPTLLRLTDQYGRAAGILVASELGLSLAQSWEQGEHAFTADATEFVASVCCPMPAVGLLGFITADGDVLTGDVWLVGENGIVVREDPDIFIPGSTIVRIDIVGEPLFKRALCNATMDSPAGTVPLFQSPQFLKTINGRRPDAQGNFTIQVGTAAAADPILRITPTAEGLLFAAVGQPAGDA